uniref:DNA helicase n=1 Tax=Heliothis virescens TaxID=7102 RepID=A0A2A4K035_HELVI
MAAEVPVCDVLCEAMEYLSKLGTNLRSRSESLKEKRISKNKLRNAHAVHKAAQKVLLICELSKKSLETVETGVRKVLSIVDASQAHNDNGGKNIEEKKHGTDDKFYYFEYESCKLRISKKVPVKHFMSVKVLAKSMPTSMQDKYPVYYDCKLKQQRKKQSQKRFEEEQDRTSNRRESTCISGSNRSNSKSQVCQEDINEVVISDASESDKSNKEKKSSRRSSASNKPKTTSRKCLDERTDNASPTESVENEDDNSRNDKSKNDGKSIKLVYSQTKTRPASAQGNEDSSVSELIECFSNVAKVNDDKTNHSDEKQEKEANIVRKKFSKIKIVDDSSDSEISLKDKPQDSTQTKNQSAEEDKEETVKEPKSKKRKLGENEIDSQSKADSNCDSKAREDSDNNSTQTDNSDKGEDSKPLIRCVNISKLLKPDIIGSKNDTLNGKQKSKPQTDKKMGMCDGKNNNKQKELRKDTKMRKTSTRDKTNDSDEEFWAQKRKEVKLFKPKKFTININKLPSFSNNFLLRHKLQKIIQGSKTIYELSNVNNKETEELADNINKVKNALLIESGSDDNESVTAEVRNVINSLLNDSDSELRDNTSQNSRMDETPDQTKCDKVTDTAAIKGALLNESDSEKNENTDQTKNTVSDSIITENEKGSEKDAEAIKSSLLNDSDSDSNQNKDDKTNPPGEPTQDPDTIKSSLLNGSSDASSESTMIKRKKRKLSRIKKKHGFKSLQAKKNLLNNSSSSENEEHSQELDKDSKKHKHKRRSRTSGSSSDKDDENSNSKKKGETDRSSGDNSAGRPDEHSDSSVSKMVRSKAKPSGSSGQNSDNQDARDKDIDGHKLQKIIQGSKTIYELSNVNNKETEELADNINKVKNALLIESGSDDNESVTAEVRNVINSLLNDSDSELRDNTSQNSRMDETPDQTKCDKVTDTAAIKGALLNESDSEKNENTDQTKNTVSDSIITENEKGSEKDAEAIKSSLLNDSDSDSNQNKDDKTNPPGEPTQDPDTIKSSLLNGSSDASSESTMIKRKKRKLSRIKKKHGFKSLQAKKNLLNNSSSSENEEHSQELDKDSKKHKHKRRSRTSGSSSDKDDENSNSKKKGETDRSSGDNSAGRPDEHSDSSVSKMVRSKAKPSGSSGQNSDNQDARDKDIDGLTDLSSLNKSQRRRDPPSNTGSRSSARRNNKSNSTPVLGEDLLQAASSSEASDDDNVLEEDLPAVTLPGLNGDSISHLAKDDLLGDSDSSVLPDKEPSEHEETQNGEESDEENVKLKRQRKANAISSDSEGGTSNRKQIDEDVRVSDFEDSEDESSESAKRLKRKKKGTESDGSVESGNDGGKKKRRRIKQVKDSDASGSDTENEGRNKHGRKNIRKVMGKNQLEEATKKAAREEKERMARITERQKLYNNLDFDESGKPDEVVLEKVVLDFDPETKEPLIEVDRGLVKKLKPHQANGIKFMWDACFESVKRIKKDKGSGCILAHCMGLGKTLQVISLTHTLLIHGPLTGVNRVLVVCPLSTVLNWVNEFRMWLKHAHSEFEVDIYELSRYKQNSERAFQLQQWFEGGGVCVLGYEMFRNLSADNNRKFKKKMLKSFQESLVDPGPDLVVCDEGHLLKNEKTSLSQSMNRVKTRRRIVLTGTPLQNNLKEYYCMVTFVKPNLLGKYNEYLNRFVNPITNGQYTDSTEHDIKIMKRRSHVLHKMLDGAVQRRDYGVLAPFLPPKHEYVLFITLSEVQIKLYQHYLDNYSRRPLPGKSSGFLFPDFQSLQRIWTHPLVLKYNSERYEIMQQKKREREEEESEGSLVDFIDDDSTPEETSTEESSEDLSDMSDDSRKKSKKKKSAKKSKAKESKAGTRRGTRANPVDVDEDDADIAEVVEVRNENPTEWWIKLVDDEELDDMRNSHKLVLLFDILRQCEAIGDKLLVFSQSLYSLDLIEHFLGKVDEATQEGRIDEKLGGHVGSWSPGVDYFRLDGSTSCENRSIWCKNFNKEDNPRARLFLISTRAGGLGINLVAANRVVIFDVSWNPSHDVQSIFRVYRFGQKKPCYVYRFLAMGTMEEKIYERQVTKQAISKRVIDEQQIDRHYAENDLAELYKFDAKPIEPRPLPTLPKDRLFAEMLKEHEAQIYKYHEHDSLLENKEEETLSEEERKAAWEDFENEKNRPPPAAFPSAWPMHNGMVPSLLAQQQQQLAYAALAAMLRKDMPNINDNQIRDMLPLIYNSNPGLMQKMSEIYKYTQPGMMNSGMMNPGVMNPG